MPTLNDFGIYPDTNADLSGKIQAAINLLAANSGGHTLTFMPGTYYATNIKQRAGVVLEGSGPGTLLSMPNTQGIPATEKRSWRVLTTDTNFTDAEHEKGIGVRNMTISGNRDNQDWDGGYSLEQQHCLAFYGNHNLPTKLAVDISGVHTIDSAGDGISIGRTTATNISNCRGDRCFRGGLVNSGGGIDLNVDGYQVDDRGIDFEPGHAIASNINLANIISAGRVDILAQKKSVVNITNLVMTGSGINFSGNHQARWRINNCHLKTHETDFQANRIVFPGDMHISNVTFEATERGDETNQIAAVHLFLEGSTWQRVRLINCHWIVAASVEKGDYVTAVRIEGDDAADNNRCYVRGGSVSGGYDVFAHAKRGNHVSVGGGFQCNSYRLMNASFSKAYNGAFEMGQIEWGPKCVHPLNVVNVNRTGPGTYASMHFDGTVLPERLNTVFLDKAYDRDVADIVWSGRRTILADPAGARDPMAVPTPGIVNDRFFNDAPQSGEIAEWVCTKTHEEAATWKALNTVA